MSWIIVGSAGVNCMPASELKSLACVKTSSDINKRVDYMVIMMGQYSQYNRYFCTGYDIGQDFFKTGNI